MKCLIKFNKNVFFDICFKLIVKKALKYRISNNFYLIVNIRSLKRKSFPVQSEKRYIDTFSLNVHRVENVVRCRLFKSNLSTICHSHRDTYAALNALKFHINSSIVTTKN